jgi:hypothetical protein
MRYRLMATYRGVPYEVGLGPSNSDVVLFAACPPPEELGFEPATGHWRKPVIRAEIDALWESRPVGIFRGEPCIVLDDPDERLHIAYLGTDADKAVGLGYWQVDRGVFELLTQREEVAELTEERVDKPLLWGEQADATGPLATYPYGKAPWPVAVSPIPEPPGEAAPVAEDALAAGPPMGDTTVAGIPAVTGPMPGLPPADFPLADPMADAPQADVPLTGPAADAPPADFPLAGPMADAPQADFPLAGPMADARQAEVPVANVQQAGPPVPGTTMADDLAADVPMVNVPQARTPLAETTMASAPLADTTMASAPLANAQVSDAPAASVPPAGVPPAGVPPGSVPPGSVPAGSAGPAGAQPGSARPETAAPPAFGAPSAPPAPAEDGAQLAAGTWTTDMNGGMDPHPGPIPPGDPLSFPADAGSQALPVQPGFYDPVSAGPLSADPMSAEPASAEPTSDIGRRAARRQRVPTREIFCELADLASIPRAAYALETETDGTMCLLPTPDGFEVFFAANGARHELRSFAEEEAAYFYLFGVLAAEAIRSGGLVPAVTVANPHGAS